MGFDSIDSAEIGSSELSSGSGWAGNFSPGDGGPFHQLPVGVGISAPLSAQSVQ